MSRNSVQALMKQALGLEDAGEGAAVVINVNVDNDKEEAVELVEEEVALAEEEEEAKTEAEVIDELETAAATLESIALSLEAHAQEGGIDPMAAVYLTHALNGVYDRIGLRNTTPALESFGGGSSDRLAATTISVEEIKENIKKVLQAIKAAVVKAVQSMLDFFAKVMGGFEKVTARVETLKKKIGELSGKKAEGKISSAVLARLSVGGKVDSVKAVDNTIKAFGGIYGTFGGKLAQAIEDASAGKEPRVSNLAEGLNMSEIAAGLEIDSAKQGAFEMPTFVNKGAKLSESETTVDPLSQTELKDLLNKLGVFAKDMADSKKDVKEMGSKIKAAVSKLDAEGKVKPSDFSKLANGGIRLFNQFNGFAFKTVRAALMLSEKSIAAYK